MEESILVSIKNLLGLKDESYNVFDSEIIVAINSAISVLTQLGVGPAEGFSIQDSNSTWSELITNDERDSLEMVKTYVYLKTRLVFDPPASSFVLDSMKSQILELEWRMNVAVDY